MNLLFAMAGMLALALAGAGLLRFVWPAFGDVPRPARLALGYCAGCWLVTMIFFGAYLAGISFSRGLVITPVVILAAASCWGRRLGGWAQPLVAGAGCRCTAVLPAGLCLVAFALSWLRPVYGYDAVMMWALKAKMMFFAQTWPATMFDPFTTPHTEYPPLIPSAQAFVFLWLGRFDDVASRTVFATFFASGAAILWWLLGEFRVHRVWVLWWCALPVFMDQVKLTYAGLPMAVYLLTFYGAVVLWLREPVRRDWLWLASIFGGMTFWVKQDALIGVGAGLLALAICRKLSWKLVAVTGLIVAPWRVLVWTKDLPNDFAITFADFPAKTAQVAQALLHDTIVGGDFAFFWPVAIIALLFRFRSTRSPETRWLLVSLILGLVGIFAVYWFSTPDLAKLLATSLDRVLIGLVAPALLLTALLWFEGHVARLALVIVTVGLGIFEVCQHCRSCADLWREFGGKTLAQQRVLAVEPALREQITHAFNSFPPGTHVQVLPKHSLWRHRFYYETYPYLIVDNSATNVIQLTTE